MHGSSMGHIVDCHGNGVRTQVLRFEPMCDLFGVEPVFRGMRDKNIRQPFLLGNPLRGR
jgi:hypothetical protein